MSRWVKALVTVGGVGYLPASGTAASVLTVLAVAAVPSPWADPALFLASCCGFFLCAPAVQILESRDPSCFVLDEVCGMSLALLGISLNMPRMLFGLLLFRFFDIVKPLGIRRLDQWKHPASIMLDDFAAGLYANGVLRIAMVIWPGVFR